MKIKIVVYILLTAILVFIVVQNQHRVSFWFFGERNVSILLLMGIAAAMGLVVGAYLFHSQKSSSPTGEDDVDWPEEDEEDTLDDEDRDYIS